MTNNTIFTFSVEEKLQLKSYGILLIVLFGSQAQKVALKTSDYDIGVLLDPRVQHTDTKTIYDKLYDLFSSKINKLINIDIVFFETAPLELQFNASKYGILLFEYSSGEFARFREDVMNKYADFAPLREVFQSATLARIP